MILDRMVENKYREVEELVRPRTGMSEAVRREGLSVIGEIKRASPSKGVINGTVDPLAQLRLYEEGGADAVSILTDKVFFGGSGEDFRLLRGNTSLPLLRKDFIVAEVQVYESLFLGADALLLIAAVLGKARLKTLLKLTRSLGLEAIVEVHTEDELLSVLDLKPTLLGINNRNLDDFSVDLRTTERLLNRLISIAGADRPLVISESGVSSEGDAAWLAGLGVDAVLVGEALMRSENPAASLRAFKKAGRTEAA